MTTPSSLFVIADSISVQYGPYLAQLLSGAFTYDRKGGLPGSVQRVNEPDVNGGDSSMVLAYLRHQVRVNQFKTDWLLLNCGLHDVKRDRAAGAESTQISQDDYRANLTQIIEIARGCCEHLVWVRSTPVDDQVHAKHPEFVRYDADVLAYNAIADALMAAAGAKIIDLYGFVEALDETLYVDHVHFTESVRKQQAAFIAGHLHSWARM